MRILMTGASSFTGMWFAKSLVEANHALTLPLKRSANAYQGIRKDRVEEIKKHSNTLYEHPFGSVQFLKLIENSPPFDLFCHHAADVTDYRTPSFDFAKALAINTENLPLVLTTLASKGCFHAVLTGSVFERDEGSGSDGLEALSPYGLSKGLTYEAFRFFCHKQKFHLGKFVIPNPFGPYEEDRFTSYLMREWFHGRKAVVKTPEYTRDNIPAPLLAKAYREFVERFYKEPAYNHCSPSFYRESVKTFSLRYAAETEKRLKKPCALEFITQNTFDEPKVRVNNTPLDAKNLNFDEKRFFDDNTLWYQKVYS